MAFPELLARQASIHPLTLDEFQATFAGPSHAVASRPMDDFLRSVWLAEDSQMFAAAHVAGRADPRARDRAAGLLRARSLRRQKSCASHMRHAGGAQVGAEIGAGLCVLAAIEAFYARRVTD
ncbi:unnamed protein product [Closterium sp. Naga37s-1]|nr:unnamed protein product [Closterium sp. Naga37s-1]